MKMREGENEGKGGNGPGKGQWKHSLDGNLEETENHDDVEIFLSLNATPSRGVVDDRASGPSKKPAVPLEPEHLDGTPLE